MKSNSVTTDRSFVEIERKFLVTWNLDQIQKAASAAYRIVQGYLCTDPTVRVRSKAFLLTENFGSMDHTNFRSLVDCSYELTVKSKMSIGNFSAREIGVALDADNGAELLQLCKRRVTKQRYIINYFKHVWEVDYFPDTQLLLAEVELRSENEAFDMPPFVGKEVTGDSAYYNSNIAKEEA